MIENTYTQVVLERELRNTSDIKTNCKL